MIKIKNYSWSKLILKKPERQGKDKNYYLNCKKTKHKLNWKSKINLQEGLKKTINYYDQIIKNINSKDIAFKIK